MTMTDPRYGGPPTERIDYRVPPPLPMPPHAVRTPVRPSGPPPRQLTPSVVVTTLLGALVIGSAVGLFLGLAHPADVPPGRVLTPAASAPSGPVSPTKAASPQRGVQPPGTATVRTTAPSPSTTSPSPSGSASGSPSGRPSGSASGSPSGSASGSPSPDASPSGSASGGPQPTPITCPDGRTVWPGPCPPDSTPAVVPTSGPAVPAST